MVEVCEIRDLEELACYRLLWDSWLPQAPRATFVNTYDWLDTYWRHFGHDQELRVLLVRSGGTPIGILPLCVRSEPHGFSSLRVLTYPLGNWGSWYGPVGSNRGATMLAAMQHLRRADRDWDMIDLRPNAPPSRDGGRVGRSMRVVGLLTDQLPYQTASVVEFEDGWEGYLAGKSHAVRHELRSALGRVFDDHEVETIRHRPAPARDGDGDPRWDLFAMCQQVALASWQATSTSGESLVDERVRHFLRDAHAVAARNGMVDLNLSLVDGRPAAFSYNYHYHGRLTGVQSGYDASLGCRSLGTALVLRTIEDSFNRRDVSYDLGPGESHLQRLLRTQTETSYRLTYSPLGSWRSQAARLVRWAKHLWAPSDADAGAAATA
jgi:CelD/BcsL family acetyltransferase involved in cellulose biosynthesis